MKNRMPTYAFLLFCSVFALVHACAPSEVTKERTEESVTGETVTESNRETVDAAGETVADVQQEQVPEKTLEDTNTTEERVEYQPDATACNIPSQVSDPEAIRTEYGWLVGSKVGNVRVFKGIRFAKAPKGALRWKPPVAPSCWSDVRQATSYGAQCPQVVAANGQVIGDEDCLSLNIWAPASATSASPLPVMFFIHGGGNIGGSSTQALPNGKLLYNGQYLAERTGVVVVTVNYRLGPLGFFASSALTKESPDGSAGNYGILDQIAALKWVKENIKAFGGDADKVIIFGESAGAVNTCVHVASPLSKGLFHAALMQSGVCTGSTTLKEAENIGAQRIAKTSCKGKSDTLACLRGLDVTTLLKEMPGSVSLGPARVGNSNALLESFGPVIDGHVLKSSPLVAIGTGTHNDVPLIVGSNLEEMDLFLTTPVNTPAAYEAIVKAAYPQLSAADLQTLLKEYDVNNYPTPRAAAVDLFTDALFTCSAILTVATASKTQTSKVWRYFFQRRAKLPNGEAPARHGVELGYVFRTLVDVPLYTPVQDDLTLADTMMLYWSNLAKTGSPNTGKVPTL